MPYHPPDDIDITELAERQKDLYTTVKSGTDATVISGSSLEMCAYCEQKAIYRREDEDRPDHVKKALEVHGAVERSNHGSDTVPTTADELWDSIADGEPQIASNLPLIHYNQGEDTYILARPQEIAFAGGVPIYLISRRITASWVHEVFDNEIVYPWICARILHAEDFPVFEYPLRYALVKAHPDVNNDLIAGAERHYALRQLPKSWVKPDREFDRESSLHDDIEAYTGRYDPEMFKKDIRRWRRVFRGEEEPQGTGHTGRCRSCEYQDGCPVSSV